MLFILVIYKKDSPIRLGGDGGSYRFTKPCMRRTFQIGIPVALERITLNAAQIIVTALLAGLGTAAMAANHLAVSAESISYMPAFGIATAATTLVGQAVGAGRKDLAMSFAKISTILGMIFMSVTGVLLFFFGGQIVSLFIRDTQVIQLGGQVLRIEAFAQPLFAASIVATGALRGAGDTKGPFLISLISMWGVRITVSALFVGSLGLVGIWVAMCSELCVRGIIFLIRLYRGRWLKMA